MSTTSSTTPSSVQAAPQPLLAGENSPFERFLIKLFTVVPALAVAAAVPLAWGWGLGWTDVGLAVFFYSLTCLGVTIGFHRYFTHGAFKANRALRISLAVAGSMSMQGPIIGWVADHRRHHAFADREGDPHSPWLFGTSIGALAKGFWHAHMGWMFRRELTNAARFAPDLLADPDIQRVNRLFPVLTATTLLAPAVAGGLISWSWWGALTAFFWASLVRVAVLHHITWSVNSICHMIGDRPFEARDKSANFWPLAIVSMGESWHNSHHADPTCARHGVRRGQIDISARLIRVFEIFGWATAVRWPRPERMARKLKASGDVRTAA
ncbi:stearoyl-CoA desaturase (delta-9 desaturase) [Lentzea waywayandensis]|uniref:Stearoyl-CoA desaturase (Delta-9 desaturase) n=1 Tax=Lentzea waywayandensis TaxID=84724 RepID=A0A1I6FDA2_9PSEU|nr:acyl-CoA desaturase [Lentzea waywayandensis]SFR27955.1 stearoyl-CoA desaturase (delta-9 desaturase) [Lentzea waywayandensis]